MGALDYVRRWWELNAWFFGKLHHVADAIAGLAFVVTVVLGIAVFHQQLGLSLPIPESMLMGFYYAFLTSAGVFVVAVLVQTTAAIRAFFMRLWVRVLDTVTDR